MSFPHQDRDFADLVAVVARRRRLAPALVEKDYWVTHVLWGLHRLLAEEMLDRRQVSTIPSASDLAFNPDEGPRFAAIREAHQAIAPMFWGPRISMDAACASIRTWVEQRLGAV